jgi:tRNA A37 threonylcarbamoyladenosine dehydratase
MSQQLINRSLDLKQLREEGYDIEVRSGHLLVKSVPYVNSKREIRRGTLVTPIGDISGNVIRPPSEHTASFAGDHPCRPDGSPIEQIRHSSETKTIARGVVVNHMFSARPKPDGKYRDYHHKMTTYVGLISGPARSIDPTATAQTCVIGEPPEDDSPFNYIDSASTRAGISAVTAKLEDKKIAIVGVGGTGSYVLDLVAKTPVSEIHLYDGDVFANHNAFRSPGAPSLEELKTRPLKATYFRDLYARMHRRVFAHEAFLDDDNISELRTMDFVFLCLDRGTDKLSIIERLEEWGHSFIDVGMGVDLVGDTLRGILRITTSTAQKRDHLRKRVPFSDGGIENDYSRNIQIADLNALNAALAVIKWKKLCGFYQDLEKEHCSAYTVNGNALANEDQA